MVSRLKIQIEAEKIRSKYRVKRPNILKPHLPPREIFIQLHHVPYHPKRFLFTSTRFIGTIKG
jgi:hypothetical protein